MHDRTAIGLLLVTIGVAAGCGPRSASEGDRAKPEVRFEEVRFRVLRGDGLLASGEAAWLAYHRDTGDLAAGNVAALFPERGGPEARCTAPRLRGNARTRTLLAEGGVRLERGADVATTETVRYDPDDGLLYGDRSVALRGPGHRLTGPSFVLDLRRGALHVRGGAQLEVAREVP